MEHLDKKFFYDLSFEELETFFIQADLPKYRAKQVWLFVYKQGISDFNSMTNLPLSLRQLLSETFILERLKIEKVSTSEDKTKKILVRCLDGNTFEAVIIPEKDYFTVCVSSQIGCNMGCKFCCTGSQKMIRNISTGEIVMQFLLAKDLIQDWKKNVKKLKNIVFMGMGEPLLNLDNVTKAIKILTSTDGLEISRHHITISTCGIVPNIKKCAKELKVNLALSLHAIDDESRSSLMPINKKFPLKEVLKACREYSLLTKTKITFEYILIDGVNDSEQDAKKLVSLISGINSKINLIPFNPWEGCSFMTSRENRISKFSNVLKQKGYDILIRRSKGGDVDAACGQLKMRNL